MEEQRQQMQLFICLNSKTKTRKTPLEVAPTALAQKHEKQEEIRHIDP